ARHGGPTGSCRPPFSPGRNEARGGADDEAVKQNHAAQEDLVLGQHHMKCVHQDSPFSIQFHRAINRSEPFSVAPVSNCNACSLHNSLAIGWLIPCIAPPHIHTHATCSGALAVVVFRKEDQPVRELKKSAYPSPPPRG